MEAPQPIRWGIIGCGDVVEKKSGPPLMGSEACPSTQGRSRVVAVYSRTREKADRYARTNGVEHVFACVDELIQCTEVDAVYIATPPSSHVDLALKVAQSGKA
eukprot:TRINITY_DN1468_c0_g2_i4.p2 TRINITY_DN1468_c0_g2~~TRINITY_DN1468_c0_g2_i4.p2  ORF type:complete len:103 (+),score=10.94 TRINITY_DN1468_c0_g2_i4:132-440(+)